MNLMYRLPLAIALLTTTPFFTAKCEAQMPQPSSEMVVDGRHEIVVLAQQGRIAWADVADAIATRIKLDPESLRHVFPSGSIDLNSPATAFALIGIDLALGDAVSLHLQPIGNGQAQLRVAFDEKAFAWLRPTRQSVPASMDWDQACFERGGSDFLRKPVVVFLHGLKSSPQRFNEIRSYLKSRGFATAAAAYDDQQSIAESAKQLADLTRETIEKSGTNPRLVLVGHSMGGLVAREWIEKDDLYHPSLGGLITVGTPHKGSSWASMPPLLDLFADGSLDAAGVMDVLLHQTSADGMNDLMPGSAFLQRLAARPRRQGVRYTAIVGTGSPVTEDEVNQARETLKLLGAQEGFLKAIQPRIRPLLGNFDEVIQGRGDGVVAVESATIPGVDDTLVVPQAHIDFFRPSPDGSIPKVWIEIEKRLGASAAKTVE